MKNKQCEIWFDQWVMWKAGELPALPPKPQGFDLWLLGDNPLGLEFDNVRTEPSLTIRRKDSTKITPSYNLCFQLELKLEVTPNDTPNVRQPISPN